MKHGHGTAIYTGINGKGHEEYDGDWVDDLMHGFGKYTFTSGGIYTGEWSRGKMHGKGKMLNADGTSYDGDWRDNAMSGEGIYIDIDKVKWEGIFINGSYESKIQKKLRVEKEIEDKVFEYQIKARNFFTDFLNAFALSEKKKNLKEVLSAYFASPDSCIDFVQEPYSKFEERSPEKWNELLRASFNDGKMNLRVLKIRGDSTVLKQEAILVDQLRVKKGGQLVEFKCSLNDKQYEGVICELSTDSWALVVLQEKQ